jgi:hypothetical protein
MERKRASQRRLSADFAALNPGYAARLFIRNASVRGEACLADAAVVYRNRRCRSTLRCATVLRLTPARVTQSTTLFYVEDWKRRVLYFFFRRAFVLRAPFFAADFVFVFRFFAMLPS